MNLNIIAKLLHNTVVIKRSVWISSCLRIIVAGKVGSFGYNKVIVVHEILGI